ncbi:hypothetical protein WJX84_009626 [Apatococcus fuscideae]|uniref:Uncharacterized protein n=1 Tax=Apatococcus fuscideae TaxID=2026836 RepID=A0AAW1T6N4_9CHLO
MSGLIDLLQLLPSTSDSPQEQNNELDAFARSLFTPALSAGSAAASSAPVLLAENAARGDAIEPRLAAGIRATAQSEPPEGLTAVATSSGEVAAVHQGDASEEANAAGLQVQPRGVPYLPSAQNGRRAAAQLRPVKPRKVYSRHKNQAAGQAALMSAAVSGVTSMTPFQRRPTTGNAEVQLAHAIAGLEQPQAQAYMLTSMQQAAAARGHGQTRTALLRAQNLQELYPQPGWEPVVPAQGGIMRVYKAIAQGCLGHVLSTRVLSAPVSLGQLAAMPFPDKMDLLDKVTACIKQAQGRRSHPDNAADMLSLELTGDFVLLGAVFFNTSQPDMLRDQRPLRLSAPGAHPLQMGELGMNTRQLSLARSIYLEQTSDMARIASEREQLLHVIACHSSTACTGQPCSEIHLALMEAVAALQDNAAEQQEHHALPLLDVKKSLSQMLKKSPPAYGLQGFEPKTSMLQDTLIASN